MLRFSPNLNKCRNVHITEPLEKMTGLPCVAENDANMRTNVLGTQSLLDAAKAHKVPKFVHVSTDEVYGSVPEGESVETDPLEPNSPYSVSKAASDM